MTNNPNLRIWDKVEKTDPAYTKPIVGKDYKGTSVNVAYNIKRITEQLGPVGFAWGWHVVSERYNRFGSGDNEIVLHSCVVRAWFRQEDGTTREVEEIGATKIAFATKNGSYRVDEDGAKKSKTDALSKIMLALGASADIWFSWFDDRDYVADRKREEAAAREGADPSTGELPPDNGKGKGGGQRGDKADKPKGDDKAKAPEPITIVDPSGKKPASRLPFDNAASILESWAKKPEVTPHAIETMLSCNKEQIERINGLASVLSAMADDKEVAQAKRAA